MREKFLDDHRERIFPTDSTGLKLFYDLDPRVVADAPTLGMAIKENQTLKGFANRGTLTGLFE